MLLLIVFFCIWSYARGKVRNQWHKKCFGSSLPRRCWTLLLPQHYHHQHHCLTSPACHVILAAMQQIWGDIAGGARMLASWGWKPQFIVGLTTSLCASHQKTTALKTESLFCFCCLADFSLVHRISDRAADILSVMVWVSASVYLLSRKFNLSEEPLCSCSLISPVGN